MEPLSNQIHGMEEGTHLKVNGIQNDAEVMMEAEFNEQKNFCIIPFKGSNENECPTLMMKFVIIKKTMTSNEKTVLWKSLVVVWEFLKNNFLVSELDFGLENYCSRDGTQQTTGTHDNETGVFRKTIDGKLKTK